MVVVAQNEVAKLEHHQLIGKSSENGGFSVDRLPVEFLPGYLLISKNKHTSTFKSIGNNVSLHSIHQLFAIHDLQQHHLVTQVPFWCTPGPGNTGAVAAATAETPPDPWGESRLPKLVQSDCVMIGNPYMAI